MHIKNRPSFINNFAVFINTISPGEGKAIIDIDGTILLANDQNFVFPFQEKNCLFDIFADTIFQVTTKTLRKILKTNKSITQNISLKRNKLTYWFQVRIAPIFSGEDPLFLVNFIDITDYIMMERVAKKQRTQIETELLMRTKEIIQTEEFTKENGGYLANCMEGFRHDLLSPIAQLKEVINYYFEAEDPRKKDRSASHIERSLDKLNDTVNGFSNFIDLHILHKKDLETIYIKEIFADVKEMLSEEIKNSETLVKDDFSEAKSLFFDKKIMTSIIYNLLSNAIKFKQKGIPPSIHIKTWYEEDNFVYSIEDNGAGIDLEKNGHQLFVPFKRLNNEQPGVGIGLSMIKNVLAQYGGTINLNSELNKGTTVVIRLPKEVEIK